MQTEVDAAYLYARIATAEDNPAVAKLFQDLGEIERSHATHMHENLVKSGWNQPMPQPSWRARVLDRIGRTFGYEYVIGVLLDTEKSLAYKQKKLKEQANIPLTGAESNHVLILKNLLSNPGAVPGDKLSKVEGRRHQTIGGNALRAAVMGANDGLVSNMSLVMGVAGATNGGDSVLLAGLAGLLAGALSMSLGEWISVKSSQELYQRQMDLEMEEIENNPEGERKELALIYMAKGIPEDQAHEMARQAMQNPDEAHAILVREELGISEEEMKGSPWEAAFASFFLFAIGAIIPVIPFFWPGSTLTILLSLSFSAVGLFLIGAAITLFTGRSVWLSGFRQVLFGLAAAGVTFGVGKLIGISVAG